jgi:hypothetical protein
MQKFVIAGLLSSPHYCVLLLTDMRDSEPAITLSYLSFSKNNRPAIVNSKYMTTHTRYSGSFL